MPKHGERKLLLAGIVLSALAYGLIAVDGSIAIIGVGVTLLGIGNGLVTPSVNGSISLLSGKDVQGSHLGVSQSLSSLARILGPPTGGWLYSRGHGLPFAAAAVICALGLLLALRAGAGIPERGKE